MESPSEAKPSLSSLEDLINAYPFDSDSSEDETAVRNNPINLLPDYVCKRKINTTKVSFQLNDIETHLIPCLQDMDVQEIRETWYSHDDFKVIKTDNKKMVKSAGKRSIEKKMNHNYRGLDLRSQSETKKRQEQIYKSIYLTLKEQKRQRKENIHDPELLATVYRALSVLYISQARRTAKIDAKIAAKILHSESDDSDTLLEQSEKATQEVPSREMQRSNSDSRRPRRRGLLKRISKQRGHSESPSTSERKALPTSRTSNAGRGQKYFRK